MYKYNRKRNRSSQSHNTSKNIPIKFYSINIGGMSETSRFPLDKFVHDENFDLVFAQETMTTDENKLRLHGMTSFCDINGAKNRGAAIYVKDEHSCSEISEISRMTNKQDSVWILVVIGNKRYIVGNVYVKRNYDQAIPEIFNMLEKAKSLCPKLKVPQVVIFCGS